ncbi:hypothetical protein [Clostridium botulinum]|uniref:hypothetical protein n=1 Tax=Clostridium botulinum TaxID=1491 RepID=UPI0009473BD9|nr:hypothetical protein [Clostridium botulinum]APQ76455.1 hypothetical protein RSJ10_2177 [Clostridium botulinum]MBN3353800.1 hypothetical protein [Clostridium botulinum]QDY29206.1 hypothetical protein CGQ41_10480 [Clostridium botulinum]
MDKLIEIIKNIFIRKQYSKIEIFIMTIFIIVTPSYIYLYCYNNKLFKELEFMKLLILSISLNVAIFIFLYCINFIILSLSKINKKNEKIQKRLERSYKVIKKISSDIDIQEEDLNDILSNIESLKLKLINYKYQNHKNINFEEENIGDNLIRQGAYAIATSLLVACGIITIIFKVINIDRKTFFVTIGGVILIFEVIIFILKNKIMNK